ncbi:methyltransferase domain-containing protein [Paraburkholderia bannensis]|uniref:methyltransferase domain-containing protein n=1 Tax=Paraburkholderia bannensis TaxID=765414 RepID=UPI002AB6373B|nr:methyltransferase domain-containing protein [Paraburkholderia bannensis]
MTKQVRTFRFKGAENGHEFTGERYLPGVAGPIQYEHYHRYLFSALLCEGKEVLDIASGEGYGSAVLAQSAKSVVGVDIDPKAVENARARYGDRANLRYEHGSATAIPLPDASVDILNSFETLEHFHEHEAFMKEARRVLRPNGLMIISTPNRPIYSPPGSPPNEYHVRELDRQEFVDWLKTGFKNFVLYEQKPTAGSLLFREGREGPREVRYWNETSVGEYQSGSSLIDPVYFVAIVSDGPLPDPDDDVLEGSFSFARYDNERNAEIARLTVETVRLTNEVFKRDDEVGRLTVEAVRLNNEIIARNETIAGLSSDLSSRNGEIADLAGELAIRSNQVDELNNEKTRLSNLLHEQGAKVDAMRRQMDEILRSASWRVTKPLRFASRRLRPARRGAPASAQDVRDSGNAAPSVRMPAIPKSSAPFEQAAHARATIVVVASGGADVLDRCLAALSAYTTKIPYRVVVVGASHPQIEARYGVQALSDRDAGKSLAALRDGVGAIDSEFVVLLSDDLIAHPDWLAAVDEAFVRFPDAAAVSALILDESGRVKAAGASIGEDARLHPNCAGLEPTDPNVNAVMRVACSAPGFVALRKVAWDRISPAFVAEAPFQAGLVSIGLLLADLNENTYSQPFARFTQLPASRSTGLATPDVWDDAHQRWALRQRYESKFAGSGVHGDVVTLAQRPKIVMVDAFVPKPDQDSGSADVYWYLRIFHAFGFQVSFIAAFEQAPVEHYADALRRWGARVQYATDLGSLNRLVIEEAKDAAVVLVQRVIVARHIIEPLRTQAPNARVIFGTVDLHYLREERAAIHARSAQALDDALTLRREEIRAVNLSDATIVVSRLESDIVKSFVPSANVHRIPIPRLPTRSSAGFDERRGVVFVGGFAHLPNIDAVNFLVKEIWPLVRKQLPDAVLTVVGSNVTPEVKALDDAKSGVKIVGFVENLDDVLGTARLSIAPLRYGAGIKGKVVSSLLHGLPCVLTKIASEGMGLVDGEEVLEGETAAELADAIVRLHEDAQLWTRIADAGFAAATAEYSVERVAAKLSELLDSVGVIDSSRVLRSDAFSVR